MDARKLRGWILVADLAWAALALVIAFAIRYGVGNYTQPLWKPFSLFGVEFIAATLLWIILYQSMQLDGFRGGWSFPAVLSRILLAVLTLMAFLLSGAYLANDFVSRLVLTYFGILLFVGFLGIRCVMHRFFESRAANGARRRVVIVGSGRTARELAIKIQRHPEVLCTVVGYLSPFDSHPFEGESPNVGLPVKTLGIVDLLKTYQVEEIILVGARGAHNEMLNLAAQCRNEGIQVSIVPDLYELYLSKPNLLDLDGLPVLQLPQPTPLLTSGLKRPMDLVLASLMMIPALPIVLVSAALLRRHKRQVFCWDVRCGYQGQRFRMLRLNVDRTSPNLTSLERFLQNVSIPELPQLVNVLKGDMSMVGPRPESPDRVLHYSEWERQRLTVNPGITGLAQVHGLREQHSSEEKCRFDLQYLLDYSPFLDLSLLLQTVWTLVARSLHKNRLPSTDTAEQETSPSLQEIVQRAHRTQPSAD